jgi:hypothetical protein
MAYQRDKRSGARAIIEAGEQFLAPAPRMQPRALRRLRLRRDAQDWAIYGGRPPSLARVVALAAFAALAFAYQVIFLSRSIP